MVGRNAVLFRCCGVKGLIDGILMLAQRLIRFVRQLVHVTIDLEEDGVRWNVFKAVSSELSVSSGSSV